jgi:hypothetical protein
MLTIFENTKGTIFSHRLTQICTDYRLGHTRADELYSSAKSPCFICVDPWLLAISHEKLLS